MKKDINTNDNRKNNKTTNKKVKNKAVEYFEDIEDEKINDKKAKNNKGKNGKIKKKKSKVRVFFRILLFILLIVALYYGGRFAYNYIRHSSNKDAEYDPLSAAALGINPEKLKTVGRINLLVLGESGVGDGYKLTDSIMIVSYNPQTQQASILSVPRDTYVGRKDKNSATPNYLMSYKMNSMYRNGENIPETVELVSNLTGVKIDNYILVDTDAIIEIVDAIGGVTFDVPIDMNYDDPTQNLHIHLEAGEQLITGEKAEQLLRFRHNNDNTTYPDEYGNNDIGRMRTQREFIKETLKQLVKFENITKFFKVLDITFSNIKTDLPMETAKYYIPYAFKFNMENIKSDTVPGVSEKVNGIWIYSANKKQTAEVVEKLFTDVYPEEEIELEENTTNTIEEATITPQATTKSQEKTENVPTKAEETTKNKDIKIELLNGTGSDTILEKVKKKLTDAGYTVSKTGVTTATSNSLIINRTMKSNTVENELKETVGITRVNKSSNNSNIDFTIIIGKDY